MGGYNGKIADQGSKRTLGNVAAPYSKGPTQTDGAGFRRYGGVLYEGQKRQHGVQRISSQGGEIECFSNITAAVSMFGLVRILNRERARKKRS